MSEIGLGAGSAKTVVVIVAAGNGGRYLALARELARTEERELLGAGRSLRATALHQALHACPIDSLAALRHATRDLRQLLELETVPDEMLVLGRKIEAYANGINLPGNEGLG